MIRSLAPRTSSRRLLVLTWTPHRIRGYSLAGRASSKARRSPTTGRSHLKDRRTSSFTTESTDATTRLQKLLEPPPSPSHSSSSSSVALKAWIDTLSSSQKTALSERLSPLSSTSSDELSTAAPRPSLQQLRLVAFNSAIPFVGFGFMDNAILIVAGDAIDTSLGVILGISTMCAAAFGNIVADVAGIMFGTLIEDLVAQLNLPTANLTAAQRQLRSVRLANQTGCGIGIVIGCMIGMFPLWFIDSTKAQVRKQKAHLDAIFQDVVTEAGSLVGAARMCLFVRVDQQDGDNSKSPIPKADGKFLYAKYELDAASRRVRSSDRLIPLGRGIVSRAALTGEAWNITNVQTEPDYHEAEHSQTQHAVQTKDDARSMLCVPVLDAQGRTIAVLQAINKVGRGRGDNSDDSEDMPRGLIRHTTKPRSFTNQDVQILKALASHIGVSLQGMYEKNGEEAELRLRDTIRMLKDYGLAGLSGDETGGAVSPLQQDNMRRRPLFPED